MVCTHAHHIMLCGSDEEGGIGFHHDGHPDPVLDPPADRRKGACAPSTEVVSDAALERGVGVVEGLELSVQFFLLRWFNHVSVKARMMTVRKRAATMTKWMVIVEIPTASFVTPSNISNDDVDWPEVSCAFELTVPIVIMSCDSI